MIIRRVAFLEDLGAIKKVGDSEKLGIFSIIVVLLHSRSRDIADSIGAGKFVRDGCESSEKVHGNRIDLDSTSLVVNDLAEGNHGLNIVVWQW